MKRKGIFIVGTGTGVGKTVFAGALAHLLVKGGYDVGVMKPVQTGASRRGRKTISPDYEFMNAYACSGDPIDIAVPYMFKEPLSPYHAAKAERKRIDVSRLESAFAKLSDSHDIVIVEGAGGLMVPLTADIFWPDVIKRLGIPAILVTDSSLGTIHRTISAAISAEVNGVEVSGIVLVDTEKKHPVCDTALIERQTGLKVLGTLPWLGSLGKGVPGEKKFRAHVDKHLKAGPFVRIIEGGEKRADTERLVDLDKKYVWHPFTQMGEWMDEDIVIVESASGVTLRDTLGRSFYDGHSAYWVNVHGHSNPRLVRRLAKESGRLDHSTFLGLGNRNAAELAEKLVSIAPTGLEKVFYSDNGSTAVEVGLKMAVQYFRQRSAPKPEKTKFAALGEAYHGDTLGAVAVGGVDAYRKVFGPLLADVHFVPSPYCYRCHYGKKKGECALECAGAVDALLDAKGGEIAAFVIEPIVQCPGGIITAPDGFLRRVREACDRNDVLMLADEVAVGFGRTGKMFACEHENVSPDMMALSKSLGAGLLPIAATLTSKEIFDAFVGSFAESKTFFHGHTFTAHPPACGVALESLEMFREGGLIDSVAEKGRQLEKLLARFAGLPHVGDIRQKGLISGIELVADVDTGAPFSISERMGRRVILEAGRRGLIIRPLGDVVVFFPIIGASMKDIEAMMAILYDSIFSVCVDGKQG